MLATNKLLIEAVSPAVRKILVRERVRAMRGGIETAVRTLAEASQLAGTERPRDQVALGMLQAELLHLNRQDQEALQWYKEHVLPLRDKLDPEEQFVLEQNLADLEFAVFSPDAGKSFYGLVDRRRLAGFEWFDAMAVLEAQEAAAKNKHYKALPIIWQQAVRAYLQGCWLSARWAGKRLGTECLELGSLVDAAYYAVTTPDDEVVEPLAEAVLRRRDVSLVGDILRRLLGTANLRRHFCVACAILYRLADAIPDEELPAHAEWLLARCRETPIRGLGSNPLDMAWKGLEPIGHRLPAELAMRAVEVAISHPVWTTCLDKPNALFVERQQIVKTVNHLAAAVNTNELIRIARESLPLALDRRQMHDYGDVVNLLCHIAKRGGPAVSEQIGAALLPPGKPLDRMLVQVAPRFKSEKRSPEQVAALADQLAKEIRLQVQFVSSGEKHVEVPETVFTQNHPMGDRTRVISMVGGVGLHAVARHRDVLSKDVLKRLIDAILAMVTESENFLGNRIVLLHGLREFADRVDERTRREVCSAIQPIAEGRIAEPTGLAAADATNPLNPFKINSGQPNGVQVAAMVTLAEFAQGHKEFGKKFLWPVLEEAIYASDPEVRRGAFAAIARLPAISETLLLAVLTGSRDSDPDAAAASFFALAKQPNWKLTQNHWRILLSGIRLASQSPEVNLRCNAAWAAAVWAHKVPKELHESLEWSLAALRQDISARVREAAHITRSAEGGNGSVLPAPNQQSPNGTASSAPPQSPSSEAAKRFRDLAKQWKEGTAHLSSTTRMAKHPAYREIIQMGPPIVPLLLGELRRDPDFWFAALREITGENPVPAGSAGKVKEMARAWIEWGRKRGYIA